jgi:hypothetical protein
MLSLPSHSFFESISRERICDGIPRWLLGIVSIIDVSRTLTSEVVTSSLEIELVSYKIKMYETTDQDELTRIQVYGS